jgi:hypothetical protein
VGSAGCEKTLRTKGTALAVPYKAAAVRALAPEVRFLGHAGRNRPSFAEGKGAQVLVVTKKFAWKTVPQGLKPSPIAY